VTESNGIVDLRSDTVTKPSAAMRRAMADAEVGDDGSGEDPTVKLLEETFAERVGKESAVFVPSGTMGNQIALRVLGVPGTAVVAGRSQHVVAFENGAAAMNASVQWHAVDDSRGELALADVKLAIDLADHHQVPVSAVFVENTHMASSGTPWDVDALDAIAALGRPVHLDGARLFNAEVATGVSAARYASVATTVMCCLSKGLGAPVGSLLAGPKDVIRRARGERKRLGGSMRQAGVLAAPGLIALRENVERLAEDHDRARVVAEAVATRWPGAIDPESVRTNLVVFRSDDAGALLAHLEANGVLAGTLAPGVVRLVTHLDLDDDAIGIAQKAIASAPR
jgi:threonine aldolase